VGIIIASSRCEPSTNFKVISFGNVISMDFGFKDSRTRGISRAAATDASAGLQFLSTSGPKSFRFLLDRGLTGGV